MGILSISAVEEGQLKVQLHLSLQQLPKYHSAPVQPKPSWQACFSYCLVEMHELYHPPCMQPSLHLNEFAKAIMLSIVQHDQSAQVPVLQDFVAQHLRSMTPDQKVLLTNSAA